MHQNTQAWLAFLLSSVLIIGAFVPVVEYGFLFVYYPVFLFFGCDNAWNGYDCLRILLSPFVPPALTVIALICCRNAINRARYVTSVALAAVVCAASWLFVAGYGGTG